MLDICSERERERCIDIVTVRLDAQVQLANTKHNECLFSDDYQTQDDRKQRLFPRVFSDLEKWERHSDMFWCKQNYWAQVWHCSARTPAHASALCCLIRSNVCPTWPAGVRFRRAGERGLFRTDGGLRAAGIWWRNRTPRGRCFE